MYSCHDTGLPKICDIASAPLWLIALILVNNLEADLDLMSYTLQTREVKNGFIKDELFYNNNKGSCVFGGIFFLGFDEM